MLMLALQIATAWTLISLLCVALWVVSLGAGRLLGSTSVGKFRGKTATGFRPKLHLWRMSAGGPLVITCSMQRIRHGCNSVRVTAKGVLTNAVISVRLWQRRTTVGMTAGMGK